VLKAGFSRGVELLADNELRPALPASAFGVVKQQTAQFVAGNLQSPEYRTHRALDVALLPPADPALREATPQTIGNITLADVKAFHGATIRPDLTTLVVIGDVSAEEARAVINRWFGDWRASGAKPDTTPAPVPPNAPATVAVADAEAVQDTVYLVEQLQLNRFDPDFYPLELGTHVLGGGFYATRLYHDLRQVAGLVYTVDVHLEAAKTRAGYEVTYGCDPGNVSKARALIERDLDQMRTQDVSAGELHQAKALLLREIVLNESSEEAVARGLVARAELGLPLDEPQIASRKFYALTAPEVKAAFERAIRPHGWVQVVRGSTPH
jgi:zinc protease